MSGWYYQARIRVVESILRSLTKSRQSALSILDVGCGTGGSTSHLQSFGKVSGVEPSDNALNYLRNNFPEIDVKKGDTTNVDRLFEGQTFDVVTILGVLYHKNVSDPLSAIQTISKLQKKDGVIIWNEAAYPILFRHHDKTVHGARRFYPSQMKDILAKAGYEVTSGSHLLAWAAPIALFLALYEKFQSKNDSREHQESADHKPLPKVINKLLTGVTYFENLLARRLVWFPFGVSYLVVARKVKDND